MVGLHWPGPGPGDKFLAGFFVEMPRKASNNGPDGNIEIASPVADVQQPFNAR